MTLSPDRNSEGSTRPLLGVEQLAERLGTTERFVRRLVCERRIAFHKVGKYVRFDQDDVDLWLAETRIEAHAERRPHSNLRAALAVDPVHTAGA